MFVLLQRAIHREIKKGEEEEKDRLTGIHTGDRQRDGVRVHLYTDVSPWWKLDIAGSRGSYTIIPYST